MEKRHLDRRLDQMRREGTGLPRRRRRRRATSPATQLRDRYDAVVLAVGATVRARPAGPGPRARRHPPGDGVPAAGQPGLAGRRRSHDQITADGQARRHHRRRRHRRRLPRHGAPPGRRVGHPAGDHARAARRRGPASQPWPTYPMIFRVSSAHEEGGERVYAVSTQEFLGDEDGRVRALRLVEVEFEDGRFSRGRGHRARDPGRPGAAGDGLHRAASTAGLVEQLGVRARRARQRRAATRRTRPRVDGVFVAGDAGRGQSLIVWAIAEGRAAAAAVDALPHRLDRRCRPRSRRPSVRSSV